MASYGFPMVWKVQSAWLKRSMVLSWAIYWGPCSCSHCWAECIWAADSAAPKAFREHQRTAMLRHVKTVSDSIHHVHVMQASTQISHMYIMIIMCVCTKFYSSLHLFTEAAITIWQPHNLYFFFDWSEQGLLVKPCFRAPMELDLGLMDIAKQKRYTCQSPGPCRTEPYCQYLAYLSLT